MDGCMHGWMDAWMDFLTSACISKTATEVDLHALTGNVAACLKEQQCSKTDASETRLHGASSRREAKACLPTWPKGRLTEEMSGVHLASISSNMSPAGLELTGLSTEPR